MLYTILITIVFIAELIITFTLIRALIKFDKMCLVADEILTEVNPKVKEISGLCAKISEQLVEFAEDFRAKIKQKEEDTTLKILNKTLVAILLWKINSKTIRKIRSSKYFRTISKGFNLIQSMV